MGQFVWRIGRSEDFLVLEDGLAAEEIVEQSLVGLLVTEIGGLEVRRESTRSVDFNLV